MGIRRFVNKTFNSPEAIEMQIYEFNRRAGLFIDPGIILENPDDSPNSDPKNSSHNSIDSTISKGINVWIELLSGTPVTIDLKPLESQNLLPMDADTSHIIIDNTSNI